MIENRLFLLILQHPQEQRQALSTAAEIAATLPNAKVSVGLSWPNLARALGRPAEPRRWGVLYLGSARLKSEFAVVALDRRDEPRDGAPILRALDGIVLIDGTWSQAKALWWRNPWMLKCQRVALAPARPSRFGHLRYEPRPDALSTIEAAALLLAELEKRPEIATALNEGFDRMLARYVAAGSPRDPASRKARRPGKGAEHRHPRDRRRRA